MISAKQCFTVIVHHSKTPGQLLSFVLTPPGCLSFPRQASHFSHTSSQWPVLLRRGPPYRQLNCRLEQRVDERHSDKMSKLQAWFSCIITIQTIQAKIESSLCVSSKLYNLLPVTVCINAFAFTNLNVYFKRFKTSFHLRLSLTGSQDKILFSPHN